MKDSAPAKPEGEGEQDTSMEEILQSIRKIIAEEGDAPAEAPASPEKPDAKNMAEPPPASPVQGSDILELTDMITEDGSVVNIKSGEPAAPTLQPKTAAPAPKPPPAPPPPTAKPVDVLADIDQALANVPPPSPPATDALLSDAAASATAAALKKLPKEKPKAMPTSPSPAFRSGTTVEDLVMEALRPMLKEWLDANLPKIAERIVEREVAKLSKPE